jgi:hypothetical protein
LKGGDNVKKKPFLTILCLAVALLVVPYIGLGSAKPSVTINGTMELLVVDIVNLQSAGQSDNAIMTLNIIEGWYGDIEAIGIAESIWILHNWIPPAGGPDTTFNVHEKLNLQTAQVLNEEGTLTLEINIEGTTGHWTITGGTEGLEHLQGHGTLSLNTFPYSYTGQVHF